MTSKTASLLAAVALLAGCHAAPTAPLASTTVAAQSVDALRAYPVEDMMGIGPVYGAKLRKAGVKDTGDLLESTSNRYRRHKLADDTGIPYANVLKIAQKVALMKVDGVGVRQSNLLQAVGVDSVTELARRDADNLAERVAQANAFKPHFVDGTPSLATVTKWIAQAKKVAQTLTAEE
ncbi:MAG: putative cytosolic protein [Cyanobacteria bacterium RYN_339]|nr:putative cytosolic protein [Cyanobacteria bacterium RYN_339]